jgi:cysteine-rich repeat protein
MRSTNSPPKPSIHEFAIHFSRVRVRYAFIALASVLAPGACSEGGRPAISDYASEDAAVATFEVRSDIPACNPSKFGQVYYVSSEAQFYYCDGRQLQPLAVVGEPGADGTSWLVSFSPAGAADCSNGGVLIHVGPDSDGDGTLGAAEIAGTEAVCNGADGEPGPRGEPGPKGEPGDAGPAGNPGFNTLIATDREPPGANCENGGIRMRVGLDLDRNGALSDQEVTATQYVCNGAPGPGSDAGSEGSVPATDGAADGAGDDTGPSCGNGIVEPDEQCDDGNQSDNDDCTRDCRIAVPAFRVSELALRDPHVYADVLACRDLTDVDFLGFSVNKEVRDSVTVDGDGNGLLDLSPTLVFRSFSQTAGSQSVELHFANCTAPQSSTLCRPSNEQAIRATATNMNATQCLTFIPNTVRPYIPAIVSSSAPCFVTDAVSLTIDLAGIQVTLRDARVAATYGGSPATALTNGLLMGFLSEADANATILPATLPVLGGRPLSTVLPGGSGNCAGVTDKDENNGVQGWWFYLNFAANRVPWSE